MRKNRNNQGFTLIEIIIGSVIILTALVSLVVAFGSSAKQTQQGTLATQAPLIAQEIIENYRASTNSITCSLNPTPITGTTTKNNTPYNHATTITPLTLNSTTLELNEATNCTDEPHAYRVNTTVTWSAGGSAQSSSYEQTIHSTTITAPHIEHFVSSLDTAGLQDEIQASGTPITLSWAIIYGTQPLEITITSTGADGPLIAENLNATDSITVTPTNSATYTLTAKNTAGQHSLTTSILTNNEITGFTATGHDTNHPNTTAPLEEVDLNWNLTHPISDPTLEHLELTLSHGTPSSTDATGIAGNHTVVTPDIPADTLITYTLRHYHFTGENRSIRTLNSEQTATLEYLALPEFAASSLAPEEQCAAPDGSPRPVTLTWDARGATLNGVTIDPPTALPNRGSASIPTATSRAYTITATNKAGRTTSTTLNAVIHSLPSITSFTANPATVLHGTPVNLAWSITNSTARRLSSAPINSASDGDIINPTGSTQFIPTPTGNHNYTIRAYSTFGCWVERQAAFNVKPINITSFDIQAPTTGTTGTSGDTVTATWTTTEPINPTHHKIVLTANDNSINENITSGTTGSNGTYTFILPNKNSPANLTYRLEIRQVVTGEILNPTPRTTNMTVHPTTDPPTFTIRGTTSTQRATHGDNLSLEFAIPANYAPALHTLQYQLPGGPWTTVPASNQLASSTPAPGSHAYAYRVISRNGNRPLGAASISVTSIPVPTIGNLAYSRTEATLGDTLSITAALSGYDSGLHQLQSRRSGATTWLNTPVTANVTAQTPSVFEYRIINNLGGAPSNGRVYASRNTNAPDVYAPPVANNCTLTPTPVVTPMAAGDTVSLAWTATGYRPSLHEIQWRRSNQGATTPVAITTSPVNVVTPDPGTPGQHTITYEVSVTNRHPGSFTQNATTCSILAASLGDPGFATLHPNLPFGYLNDFSNLTWDQAPGFNNSIHSYQYRRTLPSATAWTSTPNRNYESQFTSAGNWEYEVRVVSAAEPTRVLLNAEQSNIVNVQSSPTFTSFTATPNPVRDKETITVSWATQNLSSNHRVETRAQTGSGAWSGWTSRGTSTSFTETAANTGTTNTTRSYEARIVRTTDSTVIATRPAISITVQPVLPPTATNVRVSVTSVCSAAPTRTSVFSWTLGTGTTVRSVTANNGATLSGSGNSRTITVANNNASTVTATLVVQNAAGVTATYTATIARPAAPSISSFTVPATSPFGEAYAVSWAVANATTVKLDGTARGGTSYTQPASAHSGNRTHTLTAEKAGCTTATLSRTVNLQSYSGVVCAWQAPPHTNVVGNPCTSGRVVQTQPNVNHLQPGAWVEIARYPSNVTHVALTNFSFTNLCRWGSTSNHNPGTNCSFFTTGHRGTETTRPPAGTHYAVAGVSSPTTWRHNWGVGVNSGCNNVFCGGAVHLQQGVRLITSGSYKILQVRTESHRLYDQNHGTRYYGAHGTRFTVTPRTTAPPASTPWNLYVQHAWEDERGYPTPPIQLIISIPSYRGQVSVTVTGPAGSSTKSYIAGTPYPNGPPQDGWRPMYPNGYIESAPASGFLDLTPVLGCIVSNGSVNYTVQMTVQLDPPYETRTWSQVIRFHNPSCP